jgi:hypothetical protein
MPGNDSHVMFQVPQWLGTGVLMPCIVEVRPLALKATVAKHRPCMNLSRQRQGTDLHPGTSNMP